MSAATAPPCYVVSPYTRRGAVVSTQYNQTSLLRTMELMLGLPPMNQMDATATPMTDCFTDTPDFTPFTALTNNIPLDQMNPDAEEDRRPPPAQARLRLGAPAARRGGPMSRRPAQPHPLARAQGPQTPYPTWAVSEVRDDD